MRAKAPHIVIVEDDPVTRTKLAGYFEAEGYRVSEADDGQAMWQHLQRESPDLVLLDINLPGEDGLYLTRQLRAKLDVGIILVTGHTDDVDRIVGAAETPPPSCGAESRKGPGHWLQAEGCRRRSPCG